VAIPAKQPEEGIMTAIGKLNVVCVTKRSRNNRDVEWHHPITGEAEVLEGGESIRFCGKTYPILNERPGLNGSAVTLAIPVDDGMFNVWELYTDRGEDPAHIRKEAKTAIENGTRARERGPSLYSRLSRLAEGD
jgi:hypothetical protein